MPVRRPEALWRPARWRAAAAAGWLSAATCVGAADLTGRVSVLGAAAWPSAGDAGHGLDGLRPLTADQQALRLMLEDHGGQSEWSLHVAASRQNLRGLGGNARHSSELFRIRPLADERTRGDGVRRTTRLGWTIDRASYKWRFEGASLTFGRQPVDWGSGRFWQPLNVFGAFAPTDLDTDFKPGIDAAVLDVFPSAFSSLTAVLALAPEGDRSVPHSGALHYQRSIGATAQLSLVGGRVVGNDVVGASIEGDWHGIGWRAEALHTRDRSTRRGSWFSSVGLDYQFGNGTLVAAEWYRNTRGADTATALPGLLADRLVSHGLQPQLSRNLLGLSVQRELTPLLSGSVLLLASAIKDAAGTRRASLLHQWSLVYSVGNESDLLVSASIGTGPGLAGSTQPQSEFGAQPGSLSVRWRRYF